MTEPVPESVEVTNEQLVPAFRVLTANSIDGFLRGLSIGLSANTTFEPILERDIESLARALRQYRSTARHPSGDVTATVSSVEQLREGLLDEERILQQLTSVSGLVKFGISEVRSSRRELKATRSLLSSLKQ